MTLVSAGRLDRRITINRVVITTAADGSQLESRTLVAQCSAERETQSATERFAASQTVADVSTLFRTRWYPFAEQIDPKNHVIEYRGREYNLLAVVEIGRREGVWLGCSSRGDLGGTP